MERRPGLPVHDAARRRKEEVDGLTDADTDQEAAVCWSRRSDASATRTHPPERTRYAAPEGSILRRYVDGTTIVAIVGLLTTGTVGLAAPLITRRAERERFEREIRQSKLEELRAVADEAALELLRAHDLLVEARIAVRNWAAATTDAAERGEPPPDDVDPLRAVAAFGDNNAEMLKTRMRLGLRLGSEDPIFLAYTSAAEVLQHAAVVINSIDLNSMDDSRAALEHLDELGSRGGERTARFLDASSVVLRP